MIVRGRAVIGVGNARIAGVAAQKHIRQCGACGQGWIAVGCEETRPNRNRVFVEAPAQMTAKGADPAYVEDRIPADILLDAKVGVVGAGRAARILVVNDAGRKDQSRRRSGEIIERGVIKPSGQHQREARTAADAGFTGCAGTLEDARAAANGSLAVAEHVQRKTEARRIEQAIAVNHSARDAGASAEYDAIGKIPGAGCNRANRQRRIRLAGDRMLADAHAVDQCRTNQLHLVGFVPGRKPES